MATSSAASSTSTNDSKSSTIELTEYAERYGLSHRNLYKDTGKSGFTPVDPPLDLSALTVGELQEWDMIEQAQRYDMAGFTSWELMDCGSLIEEDLETDGLAEIKIHPFFRRSRWMDSDIQIGEGIEGTWSASNEVVWQAILPAIKLASMAWTNCGMWPWADVSLNGETAKIPNEDITDGGPPDICYSFHARPAAESFQDRDEDVLTLITKGINFLIADGFARPGISGFGVTGTTTSRTILRDGHRVHSGARIQITWQNIIPLLRKCTTPSERIVAQFQLGNTLTHEVCHVLENFSKSKHRVSGVLIQPEGFNFPDRFYENEELSEVGQSYEKLIWGGQIRPVAQRSNPIDPNNKIIRPIMAVIHLESPCWFHHLNHGRVASPTARPYRRFRHGERFGEGTTATAWPIPIYWLEQIQTKEYWDFIVEKFGISALRTPEIMGRIHTRGKDDTGLTQANWQASDQVKHGTVVGPDFKTWVKSVKRSRIRAVDLPREPPFNASFEAQWQAESDFRIRGAAIKVAERLQGIGKRKWAERDQ